MIKVKSLLFFIACLSFHLSNAQITNWTSTTGDWDNAANWDNGVPTATSDAKINMAGADVTIPDGVTALAKSIRIDNGALTVNAAATLNISNSAAAGLIISGIGTSSSFTNHGTVSITNSAHQAMLYYQDASFLNSGTGTISIDGTTHLNWGNGMEIFQNIGTIVNSGTISMINLSTHGVALSGSVSHNNNMTNTATGTISVNSTDKYGMVFTGFNGVLDNHGSINIGPDIAYDGLHIQNTYTVNNKAGGQVNILGAGALNSGVLINGLAAHPSVPDGSAFNNEVDANLCINEPNIPGALITANVVFTNNGNYNTGGCAATTASAFLAIPTMGEWALIILALIILSVGVIYVMRWKRAELVELA